MLIGQIGNASNKSGILPVLAVDCRKNLCSLIPPKINITSAMEPDFELRIYEKRIEMWVIRTTLLILSGWHRDRIGIEMCYNDQ
jgi:hypothetical protein